MIVFYLGGLVLTFWALLTSAILGLVCRSASPLNQAFRYFSPGNTVQKSGWWDVITSVKLFLRELLLHFLPCFSLMKLSHMPAILDPVLHEIHDEVPSGWLHDCFKLYGNMSFPSSFKDFTILQQSMWKEEDWHLPIFKRKNVWPVQQQCLSRYGPEVCK